MVAPTGEGIQKQTGQVVQVPGENIIFSSPLLFKVKRFAVLKFFLYNFLIIQDLKCEDQISGVSASSGWFV